MSAFRCVEGRDAGPSALGILAPPGRRTFLILRPGRCPGIWCCSSLPIYRSFMRWTATRRRRRPGKSPAALETWAAGGPGRVETTDAPQGPGVWVRVHAGSFALLLCGRTPGQPYQALRFADGESARTAADEIAPILHPPPGAQQELYFNTRHFLR